jgi:hypothetical protein
LIVGVEGQVVGRPFEADLVVESRLVEFLLRLVERMLVGDVERIVDRLVVVACSLAEHIVVVVELVGHMDHALAVVVVVEGEHTAAAVLEERMVVVGLECRQLGRLVVEL